MQENNIREVLFSEERIKKRVGEMAADITRDYKDKDKPPVMVCVLKGAFMFFADLVREIKADVDVDFVMLSSYGNSQVTGGNVKLKCDKAPVARAVRRRHRGVTSLPSDLPLHDAPAQTCQAAAQRQHHALRH